MRQIREYEADLQALDLEDHELDRDPKLASPWLGLILLLQVVAVYVLLPPLLLIGYAVNLVPAAAVLGLARWLRTADKDVATIKVVAGLLLFPLAWIVAALLVAYGQVKLHGAFPAFPQRPVLAATLTVLLAVAGGAVAVGYGRLSSRTLRAIRVRWRRRTRRREVARLRGQRRKLAEQLLRLAEGLDLPT